MNYFVKRDIQEWGCMIALVAAFLFFAFLAVYVPVVLLSAVLG